MNLKPEQIPDEAARIALETYYNAPFAGEGILVNDMKSALAAALPVLLGEPILMRSKAFYEFGWETYDAQSDAMRRANGWPQQYAYTLPTQDTPNADQ